MLDYIKFVLKCLILMLDYVVSNVDKTPLEQKMAIYGVIGGGILLIVGSIFVLKVCPEEWSPVKAISISLVPSIAAMLIYFLIVYLFNVK